MIYQLFVTASLVGGLALADSKSISLQPLVDASSPIAAQLKQPLDLYFDQTKAAFRSTEVAGRFLALAQEKFPALKPPKDPEKAFYVIHVLRWKDPAQTTTPAPGFSLTVDTQNWYIFHQGTWSNEDFSSRNRIYGAKTIYFLYVELNTPANLAVRPIYTLNYVEKTPDNLKNVLALLSLFLPSGGKGGAADKMDTTTPVMLCGAGHFDSIRIPSDVTISVTFEAGDSAPTQTMLDNSQKPKAVVNAGGGPSEEADDVVATTEDAATPAPVKPAAAASTLTAQTGNQSPTFDNEGKYWWDVSVAVPIRKISQTTIDTTGNTISAAQVTKQNAFAAIDLYPKPIDTKRQVNSLIPHFVGGVALASQPLHKILLAAGIGPAFANFYIGAVLVQQPQINLAAPTASSSNKFSPQFAFGINLQVKAFQSALSSSSK